MKKISIMILVLVVALASCKKTPEVNLKYVDVERDLITVGTTTATVQCDYQYIATLKKAYLYYGEGEDEADMNTAEMRVVQNTLYVELTGLRENTTYNYYYEFHNGFNSMRTALKSFKTEASPGGVTLPTVVTAAVTEITTNSAKGGGEVTDDGGAEVTERGICWSTNENPTLNDNHVSAGSGTGAFTAQMNGLEANTTYHVRAYAINVNGTAYGMDREFVTTGGGGGGEYEYVDLCLPSGTLWATCNLGANSPEEYGDYFAWGETEPKDIYNVGTYKYCEGGFYSLTKYCNDPVYGNNGFTDNLTILLPEDDAATEIFGEGWSIPTKEQWQELFDNTTCTWTTLNGVYGQLLTSNCNSIFLPAAGHYNGNGSGSVGHDIDSVGSEGMYWSSSLDTNYPITSWAFSFTSNGPGIVTSFRYSGQSIRPILRSETPTPPSSAPEGAINGLFTINENGDQVYFSQGNLQYQASTNTWRFAEHQWDYVGCQTPYVGLPSGTVSGSDNSNISQTYNGWIDLFCWGTSGYNHGAVYYQPWSAGGAGVNSDFYAYGQSICNLYDQTGQADWGYNAISNGGNLTNIWRTLSLEEWEYVLFNRNTFSEIRYVKGRVNNIDGIILVPDNWSTSTYTLNNANDYTSDYSNNVISASQWSTLQTAGTIFLPASGGRLGTLVVTVNDGSYWSSECSNIFENAWTIDFTATSLNPSTNGRYGGYSVRLIQNNNTQK